MSMLLTVAGYVVSDVEKRLTAKGKEMTSFVMCPFGQKGKDLYIRCMIMGEHMSGILAYVQKGTHMQVTGQMNQPEVYVSKEGEPRAKLTMWAGGISLLPAGERKSKPVETVKSDEKVLEDQLTVGVDASESPQDLDERLPF